MGEKYGGKGGRESTGGKVWEEKYEGKNNHSNATKIAYSRERK